MPLKEFGSDIFYVDVPFDIWNIHIGNRMTICRLQSGDLWVHSPISPQVDLVADIKALGPVKYVIAPNLFHHLHLRRFKQHFPEALYLAVPGLAQKRSNFKFDLELNDPRQLPWGDEIEAVWLQGMPKVNEWEFFHKASKTLILTDLLFNFVSVPNWQTKLFARMNRCYQKPHWSWYFHFNIGDKQALTESLDQIRQWDFEKIMLTHGAPVVDLARKQFESGVKNIV